MAKVGLALGGGGAKGLAHILMLEVFDELGIKPACITGTSIGAIIGALYASGIPARDIRQHVEKMVISRGDSLQQIFKKKDLLRWVEFIDIDFGPSALFKGDRFIEFLYEQMGVNSFADLQIPLKVVATDFWQSRQVVMESGPLLPAVKASMALPGVFTPVEIDGNILIDGGAANPLPHDLLPDDCDLCVAIDVMGDMAADNLGSDASRAKAPNLFRAVLGTFDLMQNAIIAEKRQQNPPDIYLKPSIQDVDILEFFKAEQVFEQAEATRQLLKERLLAWLQGLSK